MDSSSVILLLVLMFLNYFSTLSVGTVFPFFQHICRDDIGNFTADSTYATNLNTLVSSFTSQNDHGFYTVSEGQDPDRMNSIGLCLEDVNPDGCLGCINNASSDLRNLCPNYMEAIIWYDKCIFRYSNRSLLDLQENRPIPFLCSGNSATNGDDFSKALATLAHNLADRASLGDSHRKVAAGTTASASTRFIETVYVYVQCTPDLSQLRCNNCLSETIEEIPNVCNNRLGGRLYAPSCTLRFESYPFSSAHKTADGLSPPPPPPTPVSHPGTIDTTNISGSRQKWIPVAASLSTVFVLALLSSFALILWRRRRRLKEDRENSQGGSDGHFGGDHMELPPMQLAIIHAATNHFSNENKLGQGGFGPVYKGTLPDGKEIAVKRLSRSSGQGLIEFENEVMLIARLQHRNLVRLIGYCLENHETLLVYEYMPNKMLKSNPFA